jgi:hypothetical protein
MNKASSIALPGASKKAITTGAVLFTDYNVRDEISTISGWGPIPRDVDELNSVVVPYTIKPELCSPSEGGATSPTAPRVAGALAVLASAGKIDLTKPDEVKGILTTEHVVRMGGMVNNTFGYGRLFLDADTDWPPKPPTPPKPPVPVDSEDKNVLIYPNPASVSVDSYVKIANFSQDVSRLEAKIYNINGEYVRSFSIVELQEEINSKALRWDLRNAEGRKVAPGIYFISIKTDSGKAQIRKIAIQR